MPNPPGTCGSGRDRSGWPAMSDESVPPAKPASAGPATDAFDLWLRQGLSRLHGSIMEEPLPPELLQIIEDDRDGCEQTPRR